jgi:F-type H+-transporting ATPase subunit b
MTWWLLLLSVARAEDPEAHAPAAAGEHTAEAAHTEGEHGADTHEGAVHHTYSTDDDHDGVPNWRDPAQGSVDNDETYMVPSIAWHMFNLALMVAVIGWFVRKPLLDTFRDRALGVRKDLTDAARRRDEAHQNHQDLLTRLERIENEVHAMEAQAEVDARREEEKLVDRAQREAARIAEQAERNIRDEVQRARTALRQEAVDLAVKLAESTLKGAVSPADQQALAREFLTSVRSGGDRG